MTIDDSLAQGGGAGTGAHIWSTGTLSRRLVEVAAAGSLTGVLIILLWLSPRPDLSTAAAQSFFWIKATYPAAVTACALVAATWLARGRPGAGMALAVAGAFASAMLIAGGLQAWSMSADEFNTLMWPNGAVCMGNILVIAAPMLALTVAGLRDVYLERPAPTGFACGLFCGGVAATIDGLHCWQGTYTFVGPWFTLAMLASGGIGAGAIKLLARRRRRLLAAE